LKRAGKTLYGFGVVRPTPVVLWTSADFWATVSKNSRSSIDFSQISISIDVFSFRTAFSFSEILSLVYHHCLSDLRFRSARGDELSGLIDRQLWPSVQLQGYFTPEHSLRRLERILAASSLEGGVVAEVATIPLPLSKSIPSSALFLVRTAFSSIDRSNKFTTVNHASLRSAPTW